MRDLEKSIFEIGKIPAELLCYYYSPFKMDHNISNNIFTCILSQCLILEIKTKSLLAKKMQSLGHVSERTLTEGA